MRSLSLLNDVFFKIVFASEPNSAILRALLNALLDLSGPERIMELEILNPVLDKSYLLDKGSVLDVKARDGQRRLYNIEVQVSQEPAYVERALYYLARLYSSQLERGEGYDELARTIGISVLDFELFAGQEDLHSRFRMVDEPHGRQLTDILELHFIELSKFRSDRPQELHTRFQRWLHVLKFGEIYQGTSNPLPEVLAREEGIEMARPYRISWCGKTTMLGFSCWSQGSQHVSVWNESRDPAPSIETSQVTIKFDTVWKWQ